MEWNMTKTAWNSLTTEDKRKSLMSFKRRQGCLFCNEKYPQSLVYHHKKPEFKLFSISVTGPNREFEQVKSEIKKCTVLCQNCHKKIHGEGLA